MNVEFIAPFERAWQRMVRMLFRPFRLKTWLTVGFGAWLSGAGGCGSSFSYRGWSPPSRGGGEGIQGVGRWLEAHLWLVLAVVVPVVVVVLVIAVVWLWLRARGWFLFLDNVAQGRGAIAAPWQRNGGLANSAFLWYLGFGLVTLVAMSLLVLPFALATAYSEGGAPPIGLLLAIVPMAVLIAVVAGCVNLYFFNFVIPIMYREHLRAVPAWGRFLHLLGSNLGSFILYALVSIAVAVGFGLSVLFVGLLTCCIAFIPLLIPFVGTVLLLPAWVTWRAFSLEFIRQFGPDYDLFAPLDVASA